MERGNQAWPICRDEGDHRMWVPTLGRASERTGGVGGASCGVLSKSQISAEDASD
jgi:hypothetical protein